MTGMTESSEKVFMVKRKELIDLELSFLLQRKMSFQRCVHSFCSEPMCSIHTLDA